MSTNLKILEEKLLISPQGEVQSLAEQLADDYIEYFDIDISGEQDNYQDSIEECLAHLEEVISALDAYKQNSETINDFVGSIRSKDETLERLFGQVDAIEQYAFEANRLLDHLDATLRELEKHHSSKSGKIKQLFSMIPGVSNLPRIGLFSAFGSLVVDEAPVQDFVEGETDEDQQLTPISEILANMKQIDATLTNVTSNLNNRLHGGTLEPSTEIHEPMATLSLASPESEDGSWQELL